jgi:hypothetical protein
MSEKAPGEISATTTSSGSRTKCPLPWLAALLLLAPQLLFSSQEYRLCCWLAACFVAVYLSRRSLRSQLQKLGWPGWVLLAGLLIVHTASWLGGILHGETWWLATIRALTGLVGVIGLVVFINLLLEPRWVHPLKKIFIALLVMLLAGSFVGYFLRFERFISMGEFAKYFDQTRIMLIWPPRLLALPIGQIFWEHTNYAAFYFALTLLMILEFLANGGKGRSWWWLCGLLATGVFLTASRGGWLMVAAALPFILVRRSIPFSLKTFGLLGAAIGCGFLCLKIKVVISPPSVRQPADLIAIHGSALVKRGSAGRIGGYKSLWHELEKSRFLGQGLGACGKKMYGHEHEHSIFLATVRGGGLIALAGHFMVIGSAISAALALLRSGLRWPAVLLATVLSGLLFDRSTVFSITGNHEFIAHWVAVLLPLILLSRPQSTQCTTASGV